MLIGEFTSPLGDKNRVAMPKSLRIELQDRLIITRGYERSLIIIDQRRWQQLLGDINKQSLLKLDVRDTKRFLLGGAFELSLDKQGRFVIPEALVKYADLESQVTFLGVGEWIEIWNFNTWNDKLDRLSQDSADIADRLGN